MTDSELYQLCQEYGTNARLWARKFAGLLPEVYRRRLYKRRDCSSIHEFAAKLGGMSARSVDKVLWLDAKLKDKPALRSLLESGEVGWSKLKTVAYIATPETDGEWAKKVMVFSQLELERHVQNYRRKSVLKDTIQPEPRERFSFEVNDKTALKFRQFKQKVEKERGETLSFGEVLEALLSAQHQEKQVSIKVCPDCAQKRGREIKNRAIPVSVKRLVVTRQGNKCQNCNHPIDELHHTKGFAIEPDHDPDFVVGLCKKCHHLAHSNCPSAPG